MKSVTSSNSYNYQLQKRRAFISQTTNQYVTKRPKNKQKENIIAEKSSDSKKRSSGAACLIQQITSKMKYTRVKGSNANSKQTTPQPEKTASKGQTSVSKKLNFQEDEEEIEEDSAKETSEYNLLFAAKK